MKIYIVTSGDFSAYHIEKVFFNREKARFYQMINHPLDGYVEEYDISDEVINDDQRNRRIKVSYDIERNYINSVCITKEENDTNQITFDCYSPCYTFSMKFNTGRLYSNIMRYGRESKMLLKIAQDRLAQHLYERGSTREEIINRGHQMFYDRYGSLPYTHIVRTAFPETYEVEIPRNPVADEVDKRLREMISQGQELPESIDLMYKQVKEEMKEQKDDTESDS